MCGRGTFEGDFGALSHLPRPQTARCQVPHRRAAIDVQKRVDVLLQLSDLGEAGPIGDFLAKLVPLGKYLAGNADDIVGVGVVFSKNERLGTSVRPGKASGKTLSWNCWSTVLIWAIIPYLT
jgi:hypothetical protein